jgi:hypothetical protein
MDSKAQKKRKRRNIWLGSIAFALVLAGYFLWPILDVYFDARREGFFDPVVQKEYEGTSMDNLKALYQAIALYTESEGAYPDASGWMDAAKVYLKTADLKKGEEMKKFINPRFPKGSGVYGYAFDFGLSQKYPDEVPDPALAPLVFESSDTKWNAFGDPSKLAPEPELPGGNRTVTADGAVAELRKLLFPEQ